MKIVVLDGYTENPGDLSWDALKELGEVTVYDRTSYEESPLIAERIGDAEIVIINKTPISKETIDKCPNIKLIAVLATGYNVVDYNYAKEKDIPIIFFNREPVEEDMRRWDKLYYVGGKAKQSGELQGELAADFIKVNPQADRNNDGKIQYVILEGEMGHQDAIIRTESVVESLKANDISLEKLSYQIANWNRAQAQTRMMQLIGQYKTNIEMVIANSDSMALGAIDAYEKLGYTESNIPVFFGIDGTDEGLEAVQKGKIAATVYNDKEGQAKAMAELVIAAVTGKEMEDIQFENNRCIYLPYKKVTKENVETMIK